MICQDWTLRMSKKGGVEGLQCKLFWTASICSVPFSNPKERGRRFTPQNRRGHSKDNLAPAHFVTEWGSLYGGKILSVARRKNVR